MLNPKDAAKTASGSESNNEPRAEAIHLLAKHINIYVNYTQLSQAPDCSIEKERDFYGDSIQSIIASIGYNLAVNDVYDPFCYLIEPNELPQENPDKWSSTGDTEDSTSATILGIVDNLSYAIYYYNHPDCSNVPRESNAQLMLKCFEQLFQGCSGDFISKWFSSWSGYLDYIDSFAQDNGGDDGGDASNDFNV